MGPDDWTKPHQREVVGLVLPQREVCGSNPSWWCNFAEKQYNYIVQNYKYIGNYHMPARSPVVQRCDLGLKPLLLPIFLSNSPFWRIGLSKIKCYTLIQTNWWYVGESRLPCSAAVLVRIFFKFEMFVRDSSNFFQSLFLFNYICMYHGRIGSRIWLSRMLKFGLRLLVSFSCALTKLPHKHQIREAKTWIENEKCQNI